MASSRQTDFASLTICKGREARTSLLRPAAEERELPLPAAYIGSRPSGLARQYELLRRFARVLVLAIYLFPLLLVAKIVLWALRSWYSDLITIIFVGLVVFFFALLALLVLLFAIVGPPSRRATTLELRLPGPDDLARLARLVAVDRAAAAGAADLCFAGPAERARGRPLRCQGRIEADQLRVLLDSWSAVEGVFVRRTFARAFAVVAEGQPPVVVDLAYPPAIAGSYHRSDGAPWLSWSDRELQRELDEWQTARELPLERDVRAFELTRGTEVELLAGSWEVLPRDQLRVGGRRFELPGAAARGPYRGEELALVARSTPEQPLLLRVG